MEGKHFYTDRGNECQTLTPFSLSQTAEEDKCRGSYNSATDFTEAFAEAHIFEYLLTRHTGYGDYERENQEIDTKCETPTYCSDDSCETACRACDFNWSDTLFCKNCTSNCLDQNNNPCTSGAISEQASILRDVFDNVNSTRYDGGSDNVYKEFPQIFSCLKDYDGYSQELKMRDFLNLFISKCGIGANEIEDLACYFNVPNSNCQNALQ